MAPTLFWIGIGVMGRVSDPTIHRLDERVSTNMQ